MCRLAMFNKEGYNELKNDDKMLSFLDYLEKSNGGHGNGFLLVKDGEIVLYEKGVALSNKKILKRIENIDFDWFMYHTRITSQGKTTNMQCHPFVTIDKDFALMMNGTEREFGNIGKLIDTNDTDAIFRVYHALNIDEVNLKGYDSRFMGFRKYDGKKGYVFFTNPKNTYNGLQKMICTDKKAIVVASSFPSEMKHKSVETNYYWKEGKKIKLKETKSHTGYKWYDRKSNWHKNYEESHIEIPVYTCMDCQTVHRKLTTKCYTCGKSNVEVERLSLPEYNMWEQFFVD